MIREFEQVITKIDRCTPHEPNVVISTDSKSISVKGRVILIQPIRDAGPEIIVALNGALAKVLRNNNFPDLDRYLNKVLDQDDPTATIQDNPRCMDAGYSPFLGPRSSLYKFRNEYLNILLSPGNPFNQTYPEMFEVVLEELHKLYAACDEFIRVRDSSTRNC